MPREVSRYMQPSPKSSGSSQHFGPLPPANPKQPETMSVGRDEGHLFEPPTAETKSHFSHTQWALDHFEDPTRRAFTKVCRIPKDPDRPDTFTGKTLNTPDTITAWQCFIREVPQSSSDEPSFPEFSSLARLGTGCNSHKDTAHGGLQSALLDEMIGVAVEHERPRHKTMLTAYLKIEFKKRLETPSTILLKAAVVEKKGKKIVGRGTIEDGNGNVISTGEALFVLVDKFNTEKAKL